MSREMSEFVIQLMWTAWMVWLVIAIKVHCREMRRTIKKMKEECND